MGVAVSEARAALADGDHCAMTALSLKSLANIEDRVSTNNYKALSLVT